MTFGGKVYDSRDQSYDFYCEKFFLIGDLWICIMEGESLEEKTYNHIAFKIADEEYDGYLQKIKEMGLEVRPERPRIAGEGRSIYFYDYDGHLFELHTGTLEERLDCYKK